eukprot:TRINITY_DN33910_c0_g1_i1.p1 TRINITY_DN33910_c0_g1~~TRINITY_DN33910_c0_g1_i1.p1  ORF type:complete len:591 (-),score=142.40 TRINITY_DN33910_c0_g1_i1:308-1840(-)
MAQLRAKVEERLKLGGGSLSSRKRLRKQFSGVVESELSKKSKRSATCERIMKVLINIEECSANVRQMLVDCLPRALDFESGAQLHKHQVRILEVVRDSLSIAMVAMQERMGAHDAEALEIEKDIQDCEVACEAASAAEGRLSEVEQAAVAVLQAAQREVRQAEEELAQAESVLQATATSVADRKNRRSACIATAEGPLQTLVKGLWSVEAERDEAVRDVCVQLEDFGVEKALIVAVPLAMGRKPSERGVFDAATVAMVEKSFAEKTVEMTEQLEVVNQASAEATSLAAAALLQAAQERVDELLAGLERAKSAVGAAAGARMASELQVSLLRENAEALQKRVVETTERLGELAAAGELLDDVIAGRVTTGNVTEVTASAKQDATEASADATSTANTESFLPATEAAAVEAAATAAATVELQTPLTIRHHESSSDVAVATVAEGTLSAALSATDATPNTLSSPPSSKRAGVAGDDLSASPKLQPTSLRQHNSIGGGSTGNSADEAVRSTCNE